MNTLIQKTFLRGYKTGLEAAGCAPSQAIKFPPPYKIGQVLEDGYIYAGFYQTDKESYHIALAPKEEPIKMSFEEMDREKVPSKNEWSLISINKDLFNLKSDYYWSATEHNNLDAWIFNVQNGYILYNYKTNTNLVRCVRRFGHSII